MSAKLNSYFTTGEFAKLCNVTKHTLFHYDDIGVFSPEIIDENNYRYYSISQLEVFHVISLLRELGMPLKDIKNYLKERSPENLIELLKKEEHVINNKIRNLIKIKNYIKEKTDITKTALTMDLDAIFLQDVKKEFLILTKTQPIDSEKSIIVSLANHINFCKSNHIYNTYSIGEMIRIESIKNKEYHNYSYFYTKVQKKQNNVAIFEKSEGKYLTAYHRSGFYTVSEAYDKILKYTNQNNLTLKGYFFEDVLLDNLSVKGYDNYVLKVSIMVE